MNPVVAVVLVVLLLLVLSDWRKGVPIAILVGFVQDPIRKLDANESVYLTVLVLVFIGATVVSLYARQVPGRWASLLGMYGRLRVPFYGFSLLVVVQAIRAFVATGNPVVFGIGVMAYIAPAITVLIGFYYGVYRRDVRSVLVFYCMLAFIAAVFVLLEASGFHSKVLGTVGVPLYIFGEHAIALYAGILRSPEVAAWHCAMGAMLSLVLFASSQRAARDYGWLVLSALCIVAIILTGRRKGIFEIAVFLVAVLGLAIYSRRELPSVYVKAAIIGIVVVVAALIYLPVEQMFSDFDTIASRFLYSQDSLIDRVWNMTVGSFQHIVDRNSVFGLGAGLGSQGAQYFGGIKTGYSAESGFGKVLAELGVLGFIALVVIGVRVSGYFAAIIKYGHGNGALEMTLLGLTAIVFANVGNFLAAHQVYGDPFVISMLGLLVGFILAGPVMVWYRAREAGTVEDGSAVRSSAPVYG